MPMYEVEQYELHKLTYRVEADSPAAAVAAVFNGDAEPVDGSLEFIEVYEDGGLPVDEHPELADELRELGLLQHDDEIIGSIRYVKEIES